MATGKFRAVYRSEKGATFSAPVEKQSDGTWAMVTSDGAVPINYFFDDDAAGRLTFDCYREEPDSRLHISRLPGESSFGALQRAYAEQEIAQQRRQREIARTETQNAAQTADPNVRNINNQLARQLKPRGGGTSVAVDIPQITKAEIALARNRR